MGFCLLRPFTFFWGWSIGIDPLSSPLLFKAMKRILQLSLFLSLTLTGLGQSESKPVPTKPIPRKVKTKAEALSQADDLAAKRKARIDEATARAKQKAKEEAAAKKEASKPKPQKLALPVESAPREELSGKWLLQTSSLGKSITEQMQKSAGKQAKFELGKISGDYLAEVNLKENKITVHWNDWKMESVATREDGEIKMSVKVSGHQVYNIVNLTHGEKPQDRKIELKILNDYTTPETLFQGIKIKSRVRLPTLHSGHWSLHEGQLHLQGTFQKEPWKFAPKTGE